MRQIARYGGTVDKECDRQREKEIYKEQDRQREKEIEKEYLNSI